MPYTVRQVLDAKNIVGESVVWDDRVGRLHWVDIIARKIHSLDPLTGLHSQQSTPDRVTSIGLCQQSDHAVVGLRKQIVKWDFAAGFQPFADVEPDQPGNRLNEGVVAPDGSFWVGTMQNNVADDDSAVDITEDTGRLYRVSFDGQVKTLAEEHYGITNTMVWIDGLFVTADSTKNALYTYQHDGDKQKLTNRRPLLVDYPRGLPDGSCVDSEGYIWNCRVVGGGCLVRIDINGIIDRVVELPCSWPTSCTFGGPDLTDIYVTSARFTMSDEHLAANPQEGGLYVVHTDVKGTTSNRFG